MILYILLSIILGIIIGTTTGLIPGIHINLLGAGILLAIEKIPFGINKIYLVSFICSLSITHTFMDFIPSVFLGCPDAENSLLPGHELLKNGKGLQAVFLSSYGSLAGIFLIAIFSPILIYLLPKVTLMINPFIVYILIGISLFLFIKEKDKISSLKIILLTSIAGMIVLNLEVDESLLPMLSGFFGIPLILESIKNKTEIKKQETTLELPKKKAKSLTFAMISSLICGFLPGLGTSQSAVISTSLYRTAREEFLILIGAANTIVLIASFLMIYTTGKIRTGVAAVISEILPDFSFKIFIIILICALISGTISFFLAIYLSKKICNKISEYDYKKISIGVLILIVGINLLVGKASGILILVFCSIIGLYSNKLEVRKSNMMYCLLTPTIWFYLKNSFG